MQRKAAKIAQDAKIAKGARVAKVWFLEKRDLKGA
jgi:hypothetical protein